MDYYIEKEGKNRTRWFGANRLKDAENQKQINSLYHIIRDHAFDEFAGKAAADIIEVHSARAG